MKCKTNEKKTKRFVSPDRAYGRNLNGTQVSRAGLSVRGVRARGWRYEMATWRSVPNVRDRTKQMNTRKWAQNGGDGGGK